MTNIEKGSISYSNKDNIGTIEFHHPKGNSLPGALLRELADTIIEAGVDDANKVIVIRSNGDGAFCAGASFDELLAIENLDEGKKFFMGFAHVLNAMRTCPKLIIVRVQGKTVGGGIGIASAADYCIAHRSASIKLSELALGIGPFVVGPAVSRKLGTASFSSLALDARNWYTSDWAHSKGLFNKVMDTTEELDESVQQLATDLASSNPEAMKEMKQILWQSTGHWHATLEQRAEISGRLVLSDFTREFIQEFKKK
ncbi:enoyl-CoA hydratase/isomerase family protein [Rhodohalobacter barkolensis]|uniref:Enoyl-CoA hydratase n=1 Tax=Rhodohalobacter barkolensis TaxID=2053187 RepID=A0A2N0VIA9_9BACT|nr:enoyl-CoA hydratase/isomerase family protein [Rhodohalobacter barkolensis]PKD43925.1 enoyl-CoA hydratase [Rhodohalobacter barkolensis]